MTRILKVSALAVLVAVAANGIAEASKQENDAAVRAEQHDKDLRTIQHLLEDGDTEGALYEVMTQRKQIELARMEDEKK